MKPVYNAKEHWLRVSQTIPYEEARDGNKEDST
ncbi:hypothetical protein EV213_12438 [Aureibacillus halotolerans]|uniref:Uncharacterized protein n=1 Tax=Aureibacillus halotolerans TaxID=1508390 RepID=A0A4R6TQX5_9BACI|nr:hypothetical protein EV213_12438 [Aureibacillus halotolerans]